MTALDTNVLVRVLTRDDPGQADAAADLLRREICWVPKTVLLETEWVLRYSYELDRATIGNAFRMLFGVSGIEIETRAAVWKALSWYGDGLDFGDALHLASSLGSSPFVTFDRKLRNRAQRCEGAPKVELVETT